MSYPLFTRVALRKNFSEYNLQKGDIVPNLNYILNFFIVCQTSSEQYGF